MIGFQGSEVAVLASWVPRDFFLQEGIAHWGEELSISERVTMDDGEVDFPDSGGLQGLASTSDYSHFLDDTNIIQSDWDNILLTTQVCSHKHFCNPTTGPDNTHTHTCEHTHTQTIASGDEEKFTKKKRPSGNKEAVRKYREKQKAVKVSLEVRNAELEKENSRIPTLLQENNRLRRKLQEQVPAQVALDRCKAENKRLRKLLLHVRRLIDEELDTRELQTQTLNMPSRVDACGSGPTHRSSGKYFSTNVSCAAPLPCYPGRPVSQPGLGDYDHMESSVERHKECEHISTACHDPPLEPFDDEENRKNACKPSFLVQRGAGGSFQNGVKRKGSVVQSILPAYLSGGVPCAVPVPCFNGSRALNQGKLSDQRDGGTLQRKEGCEIMEDMSQYTEVTADSSPHCPALSPEEVTQSVSTASRKEPALTVSKSQPGVDGPDEQMFAPGGFFRDALQNGSVPPCFTAAPGSQPFSDSWFEDCDFINGVCQAHSDGAQASQAVGCFKPEEAAQSTRSD
ncbi:hypothetical protein R1flu_022544 [Riccia fluitans]|uniref:BZIP domain-containing protein n=1 Tax=Riccia fluitans TaxID=41844 RepID=A0ABD1XPH0_9MARC